MPRRGGARRARARRARRTHINARRHHRQRRRNFHRNRRTGTHVGTSIGASRQSTGSCISVLLIIGIIFVGIGLVLTFQVSTVIGIAPIAFGTLSVTAAFALYLVHRNRPANRTVEVAATIAPPNVPTVSNEGLEVNAYPDDAPSYTSAMQGNQTMQYGGFAYPTSVSAEPPPPSYAEATLKIS